MTGLGVAAGRAWWQRYQDTFRKMLILSYPIVISQLGIIIIAVTDNAMVGQLGEEYLAAAGIANSVYMLITILGIGLTNVIAPLTAAAQSKKSGGDLHDLLTNTLWISLLMGVAIAVILAVLAWNFTWFQQTAEVSRLAVPYLMALGISAVPMCVFLGGKSFSEGLSIAKPATYIVYVSVVLNVVFNWLLIFGNLGFPALGLVGAGIATIISRLATAVLMWAFIARSSRIRQYLPQIQWQQAGGYWFKRIWFLGLPTGMQYFFEAGAFSGAAIMIGWLGTLPLAAHQVAINLASATYMIIIGVSAAGAIQVGQAAGYQDWHQARRAGISALLLGGGFMALCGIGFLLGNQHLALLYGVENEQVLRLVSQLLILAALFQLSDGIQAVGLGILRGISDVTIPTLITLFAYWGIGLPLGYALAFWIDWGAVGMWIGLSVALTLSAILLNTRFFWLLGKRRKQQPHHDTLPNQEVKPNFENV
ncbi:MATE family efflux transporter [Eisenibacter elegans]|uniref:MATE family efflux transporter n=1 Tax=Eisenibacter elegans TaxID=997 RepID=UPI00041BE2A8|nr:MATE family efflux transporter [Eisenibacter elegans]